MKPILNVDLLRGALLAICASNIGQASMSICYWIPKLLTVSGIRGVYGVLSLLIFTLIALALLYQPIRYARSIFVGWTIYYIILVAVTVGFFVNLPHKFLEMNYTVMILQNSFVLIYQLLAAGLAFLHFRWQMKSKAQQDAAANP